MSRTRVYIDEVGSSVFITMPRVLDEPLKWTVPEFQGSCDNQPFAVRQVLKWNQIEPDAKAKFRLDREPEAVGLEFKGRLSAGEGEVQIAATIRNPTDKSIQSGHHSVHLDTSACKPLDDPTGERTFLYAETGWISVAKLIDPIHSRKHTIRIGASYRKVTVMWKMIARLNEARNLAVAMALDKGYAFASDHPDWPAGLLGGYRWGAITPRESREMTGKIYLVAGGLNDLRLLYANDFK